MITETTRATDEVTVAAGRVRGSDEAGVAAGQVLVEWHHADGELFHSEVVKNLFTSVGDAMYVARGAGVASPPAAPTGIRLGTGSTAPAKSGAGAALGTYLTGSNKAFDATFPSVSNNVATYKRTYAAGEATSASTNITEAALVNDTIATDATSTAANTIARILLSSPGPKAATDTLTLTWTHTITGA